jgi:hypothetical protein
MRRLKKLTDISCMTLNFLVAFNISHVLSINLKLACRATVMDLSSTYISIMEKAEIIS